MSATQTVALFGESQVSQNTNGAPIPRLLNAFVICANATTTTHVSGIDTLGADNKAKKMPHKAGLMSAFQSIRRRAAVVAASAGDTNCGDPGKNSLSTSATLDGALETSRVGDQELQALAGALAARATATLDYCQRASQEMRHRKVWAAVARAVQQPQRYLHLASLPETTTGSARFTPCLKKLDGWPSLRLPIPCKKILLGHHAQVTSVSYMPLSMLLVSGAANGEVRLWDPCARPQKLAPPLTPPCRSPLVDERDECYQPYGQGDAAGAYNRYLRKWPGIYLETPEEWTKTGQTFGCVAEFTVGRPYSSNRSTVQAREKRSDGSTLHGKDDGNNRNQRTRVNAIDGFVMQGGLVGSSVVCDEDGSRKARELDTEEPWDPSSAGENIRSAVMWLCCA